MQYMARIRNYVSEHLSANAIRDTALISLVSVITAVGAAGCMGNTEVEIGMRIKQKEIVLPSKEHYQAALDKVYDRRDSLYNKSQVPEDTIDTVLTSPFAEAYRNRQ